MSFGGNVLNGTFWYFLVAPAKTRLCEMRLGIHLKTQLLRTFGLTKLCHADAFIAFVVKTTTSHCLLILVI